MTQCTAKSKQSGERCKRHAHPGFTVCVIHGGKSLVGPAHPAFRHGRYSKLLPPRMLEHMNEAIHDPDILAMTDEIKLLDARIADVLKRVDKGESSTLWQDLQHAHREMILARDAKDMDQMARKLNEMGTLIQRGYADYSAWADVMNLIERRRKLAESERKRLLELKLVLTFDEAVVYAQRLNEIVNRHVQDRETKGAIAADFRAAVGDFRRLTGPKG